MFRINNNDFNEDKKIIHYFGVKDVNTIYLNNLEIEKNMNIKTIDFWRFYAKES